MSDNKDSQEEKLQICLHRKRNWKILELVDEIQNAQQISRSKAAYEVLRQGYLAIQKLKESGNYDPQSTEGI